MPLIYRRPPPHIPAITDADDSIVLSDLLRSGEASRLRRRGAIAIRDSPLPSPSALGFPTSLNPPQWDAPPDAPELRQSPMPMRYMDETDDDEQNGADWQWTRRAAPAPDPNEGPSASEWPGRDVSRIALEAEVRLDDADDDVPAHMLFCGGEPTSDDDFDLHLPRSSTPPLPNPLPSVTTPLPRRRASAFYSVPPVRRTTPPRVRRTNGCGALVHIGAVPRRRYGLWIARSSAPDSVVPMDSAYFDQDAVAKMMKCGCGCVREGVGCRACGNTLGTVYSPCQTAAEGLFPSSPGSTSSLHAQHLPSHPPHAARPREPCGPSYWLPRHSNVMFSPPPASVAPQGEPSNPGNPPSSETPPLGDGSDQTASRRVIYTFFATHVRSSPSFSFPPPETPTVFLTPLPTPPPLPPMQWPTENSSQSSAQQQPQAVLTSFLQGLGNGGGVSSSTPRRAVYATRLPQLLRSGIWGTEGASGAENSSASGGEPEEDVAEGESGEKPEGGTPGPSGGSTVVWAER
ncbi:hypothetical protein FA95DRAFT_1563261 [Auriscalpium vulgare]|uniref:Uncharacterized protein n=1 Tax=Auriscalpium vulgare TaxID=40419 RepID=A0ACB8RHR8_9AGAM|nr:hypothetical protein FA95DRAFT_1563261 [Auriscalpium vulgare]